MTGPFGARLGHSLMAVRVGVQDDRGHLPDVVERLALIWDDRSVQTVAIRGDHLTVDDGVWSASAAASSSDGGASQDVSRTPPFDLLIGRALTGVSWSSSSAELDLDGAVLSLAVRGDGFAVTVTEPKRPCEWWRVEWLHDEPSDPNTLYEEVVDGGERRKVEVWRDGRRGAASPFVELGGALLATGRLPPLDEVNADPEFDAVPISRESFEDAWRAALAGFPTRTVWRPTGPVELRLVEESGWRRWPARLPDQPIFYPVTTREYAERIAKEWNVPSSGVGFVTRFEVLTAFMDRYERHEAGGSALTEWWIPAADLEDLNDHIVGTIDVVSEIR